VGERSAQAAAAAIQEARLGFHQASELYWKEFGDLLRPEFVFFRVPTNLAGGVKP